MPWNPVYPIVDGKKKCIACKKIFTIEMFPKQIKCKEGIRPDCKECNNQKNKRYYEKNREKILDKSRKYGKTDYRRKYCRERAKIKLREKRDRESDRYRPTLCECCNENPDVKGIVWDHNHKSGKFRGWLCNRCNRVLGMCKDSIDTFINLIKYLEKYG
jgi:hypothetical protein